MMQCWCALVGRYSSLYTCAFTLPSPSSWRRCMSGISGTLATASLKASSDDVTFTAFLYPPWIRLPLFPFFPAPFSPRLPHSHYPVTLVVPLTPFLRPCLRVCPFFTLPFLIILLMSTNIPDGAVFLRTLPSPSYFSLLFYFQAQEKLRPVSFGKLLYFSH